LLPHAVLQLRMRTFIKQVAEFPMVEHITWVMLPDGRIAVFGLAMFHVSWRLNSTGTKLLVLAEVSHKQSSGRATSSVENIFPDVKLIRLLNNSSLLLSS
jgi:hypothetical protein